MATLVFLIVPLQFQRIAKIILQEMSHSLSLPRNLVNPHPAIRLGSFQSHLRRQKLPRHC